MIIHENKWSWGTTMTLVIDSGSAMVDLSFEDLQPKVCYLSGLSVVQERRRQGFATILMKEAERICKELGVFRIDLSSVQTPFVMDFYHKLGYIDIKEVDDLMRMYKILL